MAPVGQFAINGVTAPADAYPISIGGPDIPFPEIVRYNEPPGRTGEGLPCGANTEMWAEVGHPRINETGRAWWMTRFGASTNQSANVTVRLYDPYSGSWNNYTAVMWRPTYAGVAAGKYLLNFVARFTNLVLTT